MRLRIFIAVFSSSMLLFGLPSCVSKKKFAEKVSTCDSTMHHLNKRNMQLAGEIGSLRLQLAEKNGEIKALYTLNDKQDNQIDRLEDEIDKLTSQSLTQQESLDGALKLKNRQLAEKKEVIESFKEKITQQEQRIELLIEQVNKSLITQPVKGLTTRIKDGRGYISLPEKSLFRSGSTSLTRESYGLLELIGNILMQYPDLDVIVTGHTDNNPVRSRGIEDNWDLSVLRAAAVVRMLTKEIGLNPNQVTAAGKGEFKPATSNDSTEGREQNRRTELILVPSTEDLIRMIQQTD